MGMMYKILPVTMTLCLLAVAAKPPCNVILSASPDVNAEFRKFLNKKVFDESYTDHVTGSHVANGMIFRNKSRAEDVFIRAKSFDLDAKIKRKSIDKSRAALSLLTDTHHTDMVHLVIYGTNRCQSWPQCSTNQRCNSAGCADILFAQCNKHEFVKMTQESEEPKKVLDLPINWQKPELTNVSEFLSKKCPYNFTLHPELP